MKILWLRPSTGENISVRRERIAEVLIERGHDVDIKDATGIDAVGAVRAALTGRYDVVAGNVRVGLYLGYPLARLRRRPFLGDVSDPITDIHDRPAVLVRMLEWYEWQVLQRAEATVFVYESSYREAKAKGIDSAVKLPNAVDYEYFADPDPSAVRESRDILLDAGIDFEKPIAIYAGIFSPKYCMRAILDAAECASSWEFVFVGEGPLAGVVRDQAARKENVYVPGSFEYRLMPGFLSHAHAGFCFKDGEQPLKLREYGAAGIPTIARPGTLQRWYDDDELLFVQPNGAEIARALDRLASDPQLADRYGRKGRELATAWSWEEIATRYEELFADMVDRRETA